MQYKAHDYQEYAKEQIIKRKLAVFFRADLGKQSSHFPPFGISCLTTLMSRKFSSSPRFV